ncbi:MAG: ATP-binding protein [Bacteroidia bacterium]
MIHYIKISNFGPYKEPIEMNFEALDSDVDSDYIISMPDNRKLLKLAYIYGPNASGKTTVLKSFEFLRKLFLSPLGDKAFELDFEPFLFSSKPYEKDSRIEFSFYANEIRYIYELKFNKTAVIDEKVVFYKSSKPTELFSRTTDMEKRLARIQFGTRVKVNSRDKDLLESHILHNNTVFGAFSKANVDIPALEILNRWFSKYLLGMISSVNNLTEFTASLIDQNDSVNEWINLFLNKADRQVSGVNVFDSQTQVSVPMEDAFPPDIRARIYHNNSFSTPLIIQSISRKLYGAPSQRKIDFVHKIKNDKSYTLPMQSESSGTKRFFGLGGLLYELIHRGHFLCIDELETSLHPDLMIYYLQAFLVNAKHSQMLITTHNQMIMENMDFLRRDALWFSEKMEDGSATLYSAADFDSSVLRKDASIINAYRAGKLGGKPNIGSPFLSK